MYAVEKPRGEGFKTGLGTHCKNKETWKGLYDSYDQSISNANLEPAVVLKMNSRKPLIVLDFESFLGIIKQNNKGE